MLGFLAATLVQLPAADIGTVRAVLSAVERKIEEPVAGARVRAFANPSGRVGDCRLISYLGRLESAQAICRALDGKKVRPAADVDGNRIGGFFETTIWVTPDRRSEFPQLPDAPADAELTIRQLPEGLPDPFRITVGLIVDETGAVAACGPIKTEDDALAAAACGAIAGEAFPVIQERGDQAIRYATPFDVEFRIDSELAGGT